MDFQMIVFSCGYNCVDYVDDHIKSIETQNYSNYIHVVVDDGSDDGTYEKLVDYKKTTDREVQIIKYCDNFGSVAKSFYDNIHIVFNAFGIDGRYREDAVVVVVDIDDYLVDPYVLDTINKVYNETDCWMTHGSFIRKSNGTRQGEPYPEGIKENRDYRTYHRWLCQHLRTFKFKLFEGIREEDLKDETGKWAKGACDMAITYPILEMCPPEKVVFIPDILYVYNDENPLNEFRDRKDIEQRNMKYFKSKPKYDVLRDTI